MLKIRGRPPKLFFRVIRGPVFDIQRTVYRDTFL